jgi:hypothetical protein
VVVVSVFDWADHDGAAPFKRLQQMFELLSESRLIMNKDCNALRLVVLLLFLVACSTEPQEEAVIKQVAQEHTQVTKAILDNYPAVLSQPTLKKLAKMKQEPTDTEVFIAALKVKEIDRSSKNLIRQILSDLPKVKEGEKEIGEVDRNALAELKKRLDHADSITEMMEVLKDINREYGGVDRRNLRFGLKVANQMLEDGSSTIYSPDYKAYKDLPPPRDEGQDRRVLAKSVAREDIEGAVAGAVGGALAGGLATGGPGALPGAGVGALGGGAGKSAAALVGKLLDWLGVG